jgi:hypothetical protein
MVLLAGIAAVVLICLLLDPTLPSSWLKSTQFGARLRRIDRRVKAILFVTTLAVIFTLALLYLHVGREVEQFWGAVFAGWVGSVAFFTAIGLAVAIASLEKPEDDSFDARARILFRGQSGKHIDFIIHELKSKFEHYSDRVETSMEITDYHPGENKLFVECSSKTYIQSYIDDVQTQYASSIVARNITDAPAGGRPNSLVYFKVGDVSEGSEVFTQSIEKPFRTTVDVGGHCLVDSKLNYWLLNATEPDGYATARYTKKIVLYVQNNLPCKQPLTLTVHIGGLPHPDIILAPGERLKILEMKDVEPGKEAYHLLISC